MSSIQTLPLNTLAGEPASLNEYAGKVLLLVNVASKCGFTPQYAGLEELYNKYKSQGFAVLGFPANDFGAQEPGSSEEIGEFCQKNYGVSFPMFEKIVVTGPEKNPLYAELIAAKPEAVNNGDKLRSGLTEFLASHNLPAPKDAPEVLWNFEKFLVGKTGEVIGRFASDVAPDDPRLIESIEKALAS